jgi:reactive intermediate/imine deaminase
MSTYQPPQFLNPDTLPKSVGYSQIAKVSGGQTLYIAGQIGLDASGQLVGPGDLAAQTLQTFRNIEAALSACGATFHNVVKLSYFMLDISQIAVVRAIRDQFVNVENPPASTAVEVRRLFRDDILIEIEAIAVIP